MSRLPKEYIQSLIPKGLCNYKELINEGWDIGGTFEAKKSQFFTSRGVNNAIELNKKHRENGEWGGFAINVGLSTAQETLDACLRLSKFASDNLAIPFSSGLLLPSMNVGLPENLRDPEMDTNSFPMNTQEDYDMFNRPEVYMSLSNFNFISPNSIETTVRSLKAGLTGLGTTSQLPWKYPGFTNYKKQVEDITRSIGIIQSKMEDVHPTTACYIEDGVAANCVDNVGAIASFLLDQYVYETLCGIPMLAAFGGLNGDIQTRAAMMKALDDLAREGQGYFSFLHGNTTSQWDHDLNANFGSSSAESLLVLCAEDHYKTGCNLHFIPVTEAVRVPTEEELFDSLACLSRVSEYVDAYRDLINWDPIDQRAETLKSEGKKMFQNILDNFEWAGVDIENPTELISILLNIDASLFEDAFHPTSYDGGVFQAYFPNEMGAWTLMEAERAIAELKEKGYDESTLKGKQVLVASSDVHAYGLRFIHMVFEELGAEVIDMGVENTAQGIVDFAKEVGVDLVAVSTHSGNALAVGEYLSKLSGESNPNMKIVIGGIMNSMLPGHKEAQDVTEMLNEKDRILATNDMAQQVEYLIN